MDISTIALALLVAFFWGLHPLVQKSLVMALDTEVLIIIGGLFYFAAVIVFALFNWKSFSQNARKITVAHLATMCALSIITVFGANLIYVYILKKHEGYVISALIYSSPAFTLLLAYLFLRQEISTYGVVGVLLIVAGVVCLAFNNNKSIVTNQ
jgi:drug/metabolite transporter (DMT)-like permease